jgi:hypothetical protein
MGSSRTQTAGAHPLPLDEVLVINFFGCVDIDVPTESSTQTCPGTRLQHGIWKPKVHTDCAVRYGLLASSSEPLNHHEALDVSRWKLAMDYEFEALLRNRTWSLVQHKRESNTIDCKWVYKVKKKANGSIDWYKARLVAKGFK